MFDNIKSAKGKNKATANVVTIGTTLAKRNGSVVVVVVDGFTPKGTGPAATSVKLYDQHGDAITNGEGIYRSDMFADSLGDSIAIGDVYIGRVAKFRKGSVIVPLSAEAEAEVIAHLRGEDTADDTDTDSVDESAE